MTRQPIAIVGMGRSGTTYLRSILSEHPRVALTNEAKLFDLLAASSAFARVPAYEVDPRSGIGGMVSAECIGDFAAVLDESIPRLLESVYERLFAPKEFTHWGDKMVSLAHAADLPRLLPGIRCLVPVRDPRDVVCSWRAAARFQPQYAERSLRDYAGWWSRTYSDVAASLPRRLVVHYEELVRDPEPVVRRALDFLGLEWDAACARAIGRHAAFAAVATSDSPESSLGRWRRELGAEDLQVVQEICGRQIEEFGYPKA